MRILNCKIVNFGCLSGRSYSFKEGLNLLCADNGSGKSTLAVFIKAMFYGLPATAKRSMSENERRHYAPWGGGAYGGALEFEAAGKAYRIERFFGTKEKDDRFALYDLATGKPSEDFGVSVGDDLFGVDADGFERSLYISQRMPFKAPDRNITIYKKLGDLLEVSDDLGDYEGANERLEKASRTFRTIGEKGILWDLRRKIDTKNEEIREANEAAGRRDALKTEAGYMKEQCVSLAADIEKAHADRAQAEKRRLMEEMGASYRRLNEALESDMRALMPLEAFFSKKLPTEAVISEAERILQKYEEDGVKLSVAHMPEEEKKALSSLSFRMNEIPREEVLHSLKERLADFRTASADAESTAKKENTEFDALALHFTTKAPTDSDIDAIHRATEAYDDAEATLLISEEEAKSERKHLPPLTTAFGILAAVSLLLCGAGAILTLLPLIIAGSVSTVLFAVLFAITLHRAPRAENTALKKLQECNARLSELLVPYAYKEKNPSVCAKLLFKDLSRFRMLSAEETKRESAHKEALARAAEARAAILTSLARYGISDEPEAGIARFERDRAELIRLKSTKAELDKTRAALEAEIKEASTYLFAFFADYEPLEGLPFREALTELRQKLVLSRECLIRYESDRQSLRRFLEDSGFDPKAPLPPYIGESETFAHKEKEFSASLLALEKKIAELELEAERENETALSVTQKEAEKAELTLSLTEAEHTHALLQKAQKILKDAKEDLSTRYLKDMEGHFSGYLAMLSEKEEHYTFDTDLALSTEREGERRTVEVLSRGEQDLAAFCARLSLVDAIFSKETPFLVLDDPFVNLDDKHYDRAFALLEKLSDRFQILYTVCSSARLPK